MLEKRIRKRQEWKERKMNGERERCVYSLLFFESEQVDKYLGT